MAPIKFEENIKEKLEKRTIKPSANAWNKLSERLERQEEKRGNKAFWWLGIAASIVGVLLVGSQLFKNNALEEVIPKIVIRPVDVKQDETNKIATKKIENTIEISEEKKIKEDKSPNQIIKKKTIIKASLTQENLLVAQENTQQKLNQKSLKPKKEVSENLTFETQKIQDVVAQIKNLKDKNTVVTNETIDALLAEAQKEIALEKMYNESTGVVDANLLLQDVEIELDQSFRTKVFKALKESFITVKTAVAQRND